MPFFLSVDYIFFIVVLVLVVVGVAYSTLLERKILGTIQHRKGPKTSFLGMAQPLADALKLLSKEFILPYRSNGLVFIFVPCLGLVLSLVLWVVVPGSTYFTFFSVIIYLAISSFHVYSPILAGWSSNSIYSLLGSVRSIAQTISYEIPFFCLVFGLCLVKGSYSLSVYGFSSFFFVFLLIFFFWVLIGVVELHRAPFDLSEAESELVSGYNTDYSSFGFVLLFLSEYMNILFFGQLSGHFWFSEGWLLPLIFGITVSGLVLFFRAVYPRVKYNDLMEFCWKGFLPLIFGWVVTLFFCCFLYF
nr:NADH dehydrogenase subunit 1 [Ficopomatus enigmaticus]